MLNFIKYIWLVIKWVYYSIMLTCVLIVTYFELKLFNSMFGDLLKKFAPITFKKFIHSYYYQLINTTSEHYKTLDDFKLLIFHIVIGLFSFFVILYVTKLWRLFLKLMWIKNSRDFLNREQLNYSLLMSTLENLIQESNRINSKQLKFSNFKIRLFNSEEINCWIYADKTIVITTGMILSYQNNIETIQGVFAHELGHAYNGDTTNNELTLITELTTRVWLQWIIIGKSYFSLRLMLFINLLEKFNPRGFPILSVITVPLFVFYMIFAITIILPSFFVAMVVMLVQTILITPIDMFISKISEYRADTFACKLGHQKGLLNFLYDAVKTEPTTYSIKNWLYTTHPTSYRRIKRIEKRADLFVKYVPQFDAPK